MTLDYLHVCEDVTFDEQGRVCVMGIMAGFFAQGFPFHAPTFWIVFRVLDAPVGSPTLLVHFTGPHLTEVPVSVARINVDANGDATVRQSVRAGAEFSEPGTWMLRVFVNGELAGERPFRVTLLTPPPSARTH